MMNLTNINDKTRETKTNIFSDLLDLIPHVKLIRNKSEMSSVVPWPNNNINNNKNSNNKDKIHYTNYNKTQQSNANIGIGFSILFANRNPNLFRNCKQNVLGWICTMNMYQLQQQQQQQQQEQHGQDEPHQYQH
jgi:hypothetical protein